MSFPIFSAIQNGLSDIKTALDALSNLSGIQTTINDLGSIYDVKVSVDLATAELQAINTKLQTTNTLLADIADRLAPSET